MFTILIMVKRKYRVQKILLKKSQILSLLLIAILLLAVVVLNNVNQIQKIFKSQAASSTELKAFPDAEGFGTESIGGRGGKVYIVSNNADNGSGSLRECATASGPRICVFSIGGTIVLESSIEVKNPYLTIAGQTARGGGITIKSANEEKEAALKIKTHDVIVRYMRFRPGTIRQDLHTVGVNAGSTAKDDEAAHNVVFDHVSISWGGDEMLILYSQSHDITVQWSSISESLPAPKDDSVAIKGIVLGSDNGPGNYTFHHNLIAHNHQRNPNVDIAGVLDWSNNVVYNWNYSGANLKLSPKVNFVNNYVKPGPNTAGNSPYIKLTSFSGQYYLSGNYVDTSIKSVPFAPGAGVFSRFNAPSVALDTAQDAYEKVLNEAGASKGLNCDGTWFTRQDAVDVRIARSVREGTRGHNLTQTFNDLGYISNPSQVGGWPFLDPGFPCDDSDHDGMPDVWENVVFGNIDRGDRDNSSSDFDLDGYTDIEEYLNGTDPKVSDTGSINFVTSTPYITGIPTLTKVPSPTSTAAKVITSTQNYKYFYPIADTFVKKSEPRKNFGDTKKLQVDTDPSTMSYLKFDLTDLKNYSVKTAQLRLKVTNSSTDTQRIHLVENVSWEENKMTYNNRPTSVSSNYVSINGGKSGEWTTIDVTNLVKEKQGRKMTLMIDMDDKDGFDFYSREYSSEKPTLIVTY